MWGFRCWNGPEDDVMFIIINSLWLSGAIWRHVPGSTLAQIMACCPLAPSHCLNQCWLIIKGVLQLSPKKSIPPTSKWIWMIWLSAYFNGNPGNGRQSASIVSGFRVSSKLWIIVYNCPNWLKLWCMIVSNCPQTCTAWLDMSCVRACNKEVRRAWVNNHILQYSMGYDYLSMPVCIYIWSSLNSLIPGRFWWNFR